MRSLLLALTLGLVAGCATPEAERAVPDAPPTFASALCAQTHVLFVFPAEAFAGTLPSGWAFASADPAGRTASLELTTSDCSHANASGAADVGRYAEMWGELVVVPPDGPTGDATDRWPLGIAVTDASAIEAYAAWGLADLVAEGEVGVYPVSAIGDSAVVVSQARTAEEHFLVRGEERLEPAAFAAGARRVWIPSGDGVAGSLRVAWTDGAQVGLGSGVLQYEGPFLNAAPLYPGIEHRVGGVNVTVSVWE